MRKIIPIAFCFLLPAFAQAADTKSSALPVVTSVAGTDGLTVIIDPGGTPLNRLITIANFLQAYQPLDATLSALAGLNTTAGIVVQTGTDTFTKRTLTGTANEVSVANGDGVSGNPTLSLPATIDLSGKTSLAIPNSAAPTVDVFGKIAGDNNLWASGRGAPVFYDGTAAVALVGVLVSDTPSSGQVPKWNTGGTITWEDDNNSGGATNLSITPITGGSVALTTQRNYFFTADGTETITLPSAATNAGSFIFVHSKTNTDVVFATVSSQTINRRTSPVATIMQNQNDGVIFVSDGTNWFSFVCMPTISTGLYNLGEFLATDGVDRFYTNAGFASLTANNNFSGSNYFAGTTTFGEVRANVFVPTNTVALGWSSVTNAFAGPTNAVPLAGVFDQYYVANVPMDLTNISGYYGTNRQYTMVEITNASPTNVWVWNSSKWKPAPDNTNYHTIPSGKTAFIYINAAPQSGTNFTFVLAGDATAIGEYVSAQLLTANAVSLTTATTANVTNISITAGDWDVTGVVNFNLTGVTATDFRMGSSSTSATLGSQDTFLEKPFSFTGLSSTYADAIPVTRYSVSSTTTIYLVAQSTFSLGTATASGTLRARRVR